MSQFMKNQFRFISLNSCTDPRGEQQGDSRKKKERELKVHQKSFLGQEYGEAYLSNQKLMLRYDNTG